MEHVFNWLIAVAFPRSWVDWLRGRRWRLPIIIVLTMLSWGIFIIIGWLVVALIS